MAIKKKAVAVAAGMVAMTAGVAAVVPIWVGSTVEDRFREALERLGSRPNLSFRNIEYERRWAGAEARSELRLGFGVDAVSIPLVHRIVHAPLSGLSLARMETEMVIRDEVRDSVESLFGDEPPFRAVSLVHPDGTVATKFDSPAFHWEPDGSGGAAVDWGGIEGSLDVAGERLSMQVDVPAMTVRDADSRLALTGLAVTADVRHGDDILWFGNGGVEIERGELDVPASDGEGRETLHVQGLSFHESLDEQTEDLLRFGIGFGADRVLFDTMIYETLVYDVEFARLDRAAYADASERLGALDHLRLPDEDATAAALQVMWGVFPRLLKRSPELHIKRAGVTGAAGRLTAKAVIAFDGEGAFRPDSVPDLLQRLHVDAEAQLPTAMVRQVVRRKAEQDVRAYAPAWGEMDEARVAELAEQVTDDRMAAVRESGYLMEQDDRFTVAFKLDGGEASLNGQPLPGRAGALLP